MQSSAFQGILIPFLGTTLGSACVLFMLINYLFSMISIAAKNDSNSDKTSGFLFKLR